MYLIEICFEYLPVRFCRFLSNKLILILQEANKDIKDMHSEIFLSSNRIIIKGDQFKLHYIQNVFKALFYSYKDAFKFNNIWFFRPIRSISTLGLSDSKEFLHYIDQSFNTNKINETFISSLGYRKIHSSAHLLSMLKRYRSMPLSIMSSPQEQKISMHGEATSIDKLNLDKVMYLENVYVFSFMIKTLWEFEAFKRLLYDLFAYTCTDKGTYFIVHSVIEMNTTRPNINRIINSIQHNVNDKLEEIDFILSSDSCEKMIDSSKNILFSSTKTIYDVQQLLPRICININEACENILYYYFLEKASKLFTFVHFDAMKGRVAGRIFAIKKQEKQAILELNDVDKASQSMSNDKDIQYCIFIKNSIEIASCELVIDDYQSSNDILFIRRKCFLICDILFQQSNINFQHIWQTISIFFDKDKQYMSLLFNRVAVKYMLSLVVKYDVTINEAILTDLFLQVENMDSLIAKLQIRNSLLKGDTKKYLKRIYNFVKNEALSIVLNNASDFEEDMLFMPIYTAINAMSNAVDVIKICTDINKVFDNTHIVSYNIDNRRGLLSFFISNVIKVGFLNEKDFSTQ